MQSLLPLTVCCISLVSLQQLLALPAAERPDTSSLDLLDRLINQDDDISVAPASRTDIVPASSTPSPTQKWLAGLLRHPPTSRAVSPGLAWLLPAESLQMKRRAIRARRHAHSRGGPHHAQLMRVGCVLGTCQVQNLSHRLYQLIGQRGREDSSPINPKSPHSYG